MIVRIGGTAGLVLGLGVGLLGPILAGLGCTRADLVALERTPGPDGGPADDSGGGGASGLGGASGAGGAKAGCSQPSLSPGNTERTVQVGGSSRTYVLHVPSAYSGAKPVPLVLDFHAIGSSSALERSTSPYPAQTDAEGVIMAFPMGLPGPAGVAWDVGPCCVANVDDVAFTRALVTQVEATACINPARVYAVGTSMGGGMAYYLACHAADIFAAVAPSAFDLFAENVVDCHPSRPISVISFRGTADMVVPYAGGPSATIPGMPVTFLGAQGTFQEWAQLDQCQGSPSSADGNGCSTYTNCPGGAEVVLCTKIGGGQEAGNASVAWPRLKAHTL